jgi:PAS domain S-box-containing protein
METILVVDDNSQNLYMLESLLTGNGYTVITANNGEEALTAAEATPPDLIISDILMPVLDGFSLCRKWHADERLCKIPFVFYTATYTEPKDRELALSIGAVRFIIKPEEPDHFVEIIHEVLAEQLHDTKQPRPLRPIENGVYLREYNERLIRKLEEKMVDLEHEIAERKLTELALRESEKKYRQLVNNAKEAIFVIQEHYIRFANPRVEEVLGYSLDEILDIPFIDFIHPDDRETIVKRHERRIQGKEITNTSSFRIINNQGERIWLHLNAVCINWQDKPATLNFARDITLEKNFEKQLRCSQKMEAIGALAGGIAHDFNNILAAIIGFSEMARTELPAGSKIAGDLDNVITAGRRGAALVEQILAFSRPEGENCKPVKIQTVIEEVVRLLRASLPATISLELQDNNSIGPIMADATQMHQVVMNLCTNAKYAIGENTGAITISLEEVEVIARYPLYECPGLPPGKYLDLVIHDTGCGMDEATQSKIFDPFFTTRKKGTGSGLGLSVAHNIIKRHKGEIAVHSKHGLGTSFHIYLPLLDASSGGEAASDEDAANEIPQGGGEKILLVDDEELIVNMMEQMLTRLGYAVTPFSSPLEALAHFKKEPEKFDLLITDMTMPGMTGAGLAKEISKLTSSIHVILCTGYSESMDESKAKKNGIDAFLLKPVSMKSLAVTVRNVLK